MREINKPGESMKTLFLTAIIALSFSTVVSAVEVHGEKCPALAESNKRESKVIESKEAKKTETVTSEVTEG
jgi:hypothetical protein